jgi:hypothetical protein
MMLSTSVKELWTVLCMCVRAIENKRERGVQVFLSVDSVDAEWPFSLKSYMFFFLPLFYNSLYFIFMCFLQLRKGKFLQLQSCILKCLMARVSKVQIMWRVVCCKLVVHFIFLSRWQMPLQIRPNWVLFCCWICLKSTGGTCQRVCFNWLVDFLGHDLNSGLCV